MYKKINNHKHTFITLFYHVSNMFAFIFTLTNQLLMFLLFLEDMSAVICLSM